VKFFSKQILLGFMVTFAFFQAPAAEAVSPLRVGLTGKHPPFNYIETNGELAGFDVNVAKAICRELKRPCEFKVLQWDGILATLLAGKIDVIVASMAITEKRSEQVNFSRPYYESGAQLFVRPGAPDSQSSDFKIGATMGTTYVDFARDHFPHAQFKLYRGDTEIFQDLESGRIDGLVSDRLVGLYLGSKFGLEMAPRGDLLFIEKVAVPVRKEDPELLSAINRAIDRIRASAEYRQWHLQYFGDSTKASSDPSDGISPAADSQVIEWTKLLFKGLLATLRISAVGLGLGLFLSFVLAALSTLGPKPIRWGVAVFTDLIRATPFIVQLFAVYFGLPQLGVQLGAFHAAVITLGLHSSAFLSEVIKAAYLSIPRGQHDAATTLGLTRFEAFKTVIFPQMMPLMLPASLNTLVGMIKDSAVVSVISVYELTMQAQQLISTTFRPFEFYLAATLLYATLTFPLLGLGRRLERHYVRKGLLHAR